MDRRTYLGAVGLAGTAGLAGCLGGALSGGGGNGDGDGNPNTVLGPPEQDLSEASHPSYGDEFPAVSVPDPLSGETVATDQFEGDRTLLMTFFYTSCPKGVCPMLIQRLRRVQEVAAQEEYGDEAAFLALTFDPERDTQDKLRTFGQQQGVALDAGNWHFLRPERYETAKEIVDQTYGLPLKKTYDNEYEKLEYTFPHFAYIFLVNEGGYVERAYPKATSLEASRFVDDFETVVTA